MGYNAQAAADTETHLIVTHDVINAGPVGRLRLDDGFAEFLSQVEDSLPSTEFKEAVMRAINVEAGRLLGWIRNPAEASEEMQLTPKESKEIAGIFGKSFRIGPDAGLKIGYQPTEEMAV